MARVTLAAALFLPAVNAGALRSSTHLASAVDVEVGPQKHRDRVKRVYFLILELRYVCDARKNRYGEASLVRSIRWNVKLHAFVCLETTMDTRTFILAVR